MILPQRNARGIKYEVKKNISPTSHFSHRDISVLLQGASRTPVNRISSYSSLEFGSF